MRIEQRKNAKNSCSDLPRFRSFRAFLCTSRLAATRKADQLCKHAGSFTKASAPRAHLSWRFRGVIKQALTINELRSLRPGDCAILTPVPVKNDPFTIFFGNHPIWLPFDASDPYNAAFWLADLELSFPVAVADRRSVPLFPGDDASARNDLRFLPEQSEQPEQSGNSSAENGRISRVTCSDQRI